MKNSKLIKKELAEEYYGKEAENYDSIRSATPGRKAIVKRKNEIFKKLLGKAKGKNILDVACGTGRFFHLYGERQIYGVDISKDQLKEAKKKNKKAILKACDAEKICHPSNKFDVVITSQFLEHIPQYKKVIKEMIRVCKPGGSLILDFPNKHSLTYFPTKIRILTGKLRYLNLLTRLDIEKLAKEFDLELADYENTVVITPHPSPNFLVPLVKKINNLLLKIIPSYGYLHYVRFVKK